MVAGLCAYGFLVVSARALGPEKYGSLSALWALVFLVAPGFFFPLEQEIGRALSNRRARGLGGAPLVWRAAAAGAVVAAFLVIAVILSAGPIVDRLFDGQELLLIGFVVSIVGYCSQHLLRGVLSGNARFSSYGLVVGSEGVFRLAGCFVLAWIGVSEAGLFGMVVGVAPLVAIGFGLRRPGGLLTPGPIASWRELSAALGYLLAGAILAQFLVNAGPLAVKLLASEGEEAVAGRFLAGLVITRVPLFLFQSVQAALLPKLSGFAAVGRHAEFRAALDRLLKAVAMIAIAAFVGALALGPWVLRILFGSEFRLGRTDLGYLAAASGIYMVAVVLAQALIALKGHPRVALGWLMGALGFVLITATGSELLLRVERGFLAGSLAAALSMGALLVPRLKAAEGRADELVEATHQIPVEP